MGSQNSFLRCQASPVPSLYSSLYQQDGQPLSFLTARSRLKCKSHVSSSDWPDLNHIWHPCYIVRESLGDVVLIFLVMEVQKDPLKGNWKRWLRQSMYLHTGQVQTLVMRLWTHHLNSFTHLPKQTTQFGAKNVSIISINFTFLPSSNFYSLKTYQSTIQL